jgi:hypothetical protein
VHYGPHEICVPGCRSQSSANLFEALSLLDRGRVRGLGPVDTSAASLFWMMLILHVHHVMNYTPPATPSASIQRAGSMPTARGYGCRVAATATS